MHMLTQEIPECPFPTLTRNDQLKKYAELFEKKSQGDGWGGVGRGAGLGMFFSRVGLRMADLNSNYGPRGCDPGRVLATQFSTDFNKNEEKGYFSQSCVVRSAVIV